MATENLKERKIYRVLTNVSTKAWDKIAFWTTAKSVDAADGKDLQTKVGAINGITSDVSGTATDVAASIKVVNTLNKSLVSNVYVGTDGKLRVTKGGADTVLNFSSGTVLVKYISNHYQTSRNATIDSYTVSTKGKYKIQGSISNVGNMGDAGDFIIAKNSTTMKSVTCGASEQSYVFVDYTLDCNTGDNIIIKENYAGSGYGYFVITLIITKVS